MSQFKTLFLGTPDFAVPCLQKLIEDSHYDVVGVVTQPDRPAGRNLQLQASPIKKIAQAHNIPVFTPEKVNDILEDLKSLQAECAVVVAFGQILSKSFLELFNHKVVNVHASLLPQWRGAAPIQRSLMAGDIETGVSLQVVVPKLDAGAVLGYRKISLSEHMRAPELYEILKQLGADLLETELADFLRGHLVPTEQDENLVTIAPKIKKEEGLVLWSRPARDIYNDFRGLYGWPGSWTVRNGKKLKVLDMVVLPLSGSPGTVLEVHEKQSLTEALSQEADHHDRKSRASFVVACGEESLQIFEVQPESKKTMSVSEYLKGYPIKKGESFL